MIFRSSWFWLLIGLYFLTRLPWLFMVPMVEAPDEFSHFWVIGFLLDHMRLPEAAEVAAGGPSAVYGSLPQFGYIPHVITGAIGRVVAPVVDLSVTERFGSLLTGAVLVWCAFEFGRKLFPREKFYSLALPMLVVFHSQLVLLHSYANSDSMTATLAALIMLLLNNMMERGLRTKSSLLLGLMLGWIILTKYPGVSVYPACVIGLAAAAWLNKQSIKTFLMQSAGVAGVAAMIAVPWFVRNARVFNGDFMGTKTMFHTWAVTYNKPLDPDESGWAIMRNRHWWELTAFSYWGMFGYMSRRIWRGFYVTYEVLMGIAAGGGLIGLLLAMRAGKIATWIESLKSSAAMTAEERKERYGRLFLWIVLASCFITNALAMVYAATKNLGGAQGRYLFPSEIPIMALLIGGMYLSGKWTRKPLTIFLLVITIVVYFYACWMLLQIPGYSLHWQKNYNF